MIVLASQSPRRRDLLAQAGIKFRVCPAGVPEEREPSESAEAYVERLARSKASAVEASPGEVVLGADTVVEVDGEVLEKPRDAGHAREMLERLSGRAHRVHTGVCLRSGETLRSEVETTTVYFARLSADEVDWYARSGEPLDKAGAYAVQGLASRYVTRIEGCYQNVVGLPVARVYRMLRAMDYDFSS